MGDEKSKVFETPFLKAGLSLIGVISLSLSAVEF